MCATGGDSGMPDGNKNPKNDPFVSIHDSQGNGYHDDCTSILRTNDGISSFRDRPHGGELRRKQW
jgi:hypothetical protein